MNGITPERLAELADGRAASLIPDALTRWLLAQKLATLVNGTLVPAARAIELGAGIS